MRVSSLRNKIKSIRNLLHLKRQFGHLRAFTDHKVTPYSWPITPSRQQQRLRGLKRERAFLMQAGLGAQKLPSCGDFRSLVEVDKGCSMACEELLGPVAFSGWSYVCLAPKWGQL
ncbi:hypothetical protein WJX79_000997 [Trebouxia sp. C0005]